MTDIAASRNAGSFGPLLPGILLSAAVAIVSSQLEPVLKAAAGGRIGIPAIVIALVIGMVLHPLANNQLFAPGM
ncbi:hypothetical protein ACIPIA_15770, partial [Bosea sp. CER48]